MGDALLIPRDDVTLYVFGTIEFQEEEDKIEIELVCRVCMPLAYSKLNPSKSKSE